MASRCHRGERNTPPRWKIGATAVTELFVAVDQRKFLVEPKGFLVRHTPQYIAQITVANILEIGFVVDINQL